MIYRVEACQTSTRTRLMAKLDCQPIMTDRSLSDHGSPRKEGWLFKNSEVRLISPFSKYVTCQQQERDRSMVHQP